MNWINKEEWYLNRHKLIVGLDFLVMGIIAFYYVSGTGDYMTGNLRMYQNLMPNLFFFIINTVNIILIILVRPKIDPFLLVRLTRKSNWAMMENIMMVLVSALTSLISTLSFLLFIWITQGLTDMSLANVLGSFWLTFQSLLLCQAINLFVTTCLPFLHFVVSSCLVGIGLLAGSLRMGSAGLVNEITLINDILAKESIWILLSKSLIIWGIILGAGWLAQLRARKCEYL